MPSLRVPGHVGVVGCQRAAVQVGPRLGSGVFCAALCVPLECCGAGPVSRFRCERRCRHCLFPIRWDPMWFLGWADGAWIHGDYGGRVCAWRTTRAEPVE